MKPTSIRVEESTQKDFKNMYGTTAGGLQIAAAGWLEIRKHTIAELKGIFSENEIKALADNQNGTLLSPQYQAKPEMLWAHLEDGEEYEGLFEKWSIRPNIFKDKVLGLTSGQCFFLQETIDQFWKSEKILDLNDLVNTLSK